MEAFLKGRQLPELQALHTQLLLAIARAHGTAAAVGVVGASLQWLATAGLPAGFTPQSPPRRAAKGLWRAACRRAVQLPDPWASLDLRRLPLERARWRRWSVRRQEWQVADRLVRLEPEPFAHGAMRRCHRMLSTSDGRNWVAKRYEKDSDLDILEADVMMQMRAKEFARRFNACAPPKQVDFLEASVISLPGRPSDAQDFAVEAFLAGSFTKHSSNSGFVADDVVRNTPHAFAHFTFEASGAEELVVDIQGVGDLYTDPQIHSAGTSVSCGRGNMGLRGMALFFASHRCNSVCQQLGLTAFQHAPMPGDDISATASRAPRRPGDLASSDDDDEDGIPLQLLGAALLRPAAPAGARSASEAHPAEGSTESWKQSGYARIHFTLAMLHARNAAADAEFIGQGVLTSPAQGLFHLRRAADMGHLPAMLSLACLYLHVRPRKGVLRSLSARLQQPLPRDATAAMQHVLGAAKRGVASAMAAAAHAFRAGAGCAASAAKAAHWYRRALAARSSAERPLEEDELELEGQRLPGGDASEHQMLFALASLYETGGDGLAPNPELAWQFASLGRSSASREEDGDGPTSD